MKKQLRLISLILAALMLSSAFVSCAESKENTETDAAPLSETETSAESAVTEEYVNESYVYDDLEDRSFDGYKFRIQSCIMDSRETAYFITFDELTGTPVDDALFESKFAVEERFDVAITWSPAGNHTQAQQAARTSITGGDDAFDMLIGQDINTVSLGKEGLCLNLLEIDQFNFDKPWWPENTVKSLRIGDKLFSASSYLSYCGMHWTRTVIVNKDYAEEIQLAIPYDDVREGSWTLDKFIALTDGVSMDANGDGSIGEGDRYALCGGNQVWYCMQEACDIPVYRHDAENLPYLDADVDRIESYVSKMRVLMGADRYKDDSSYGTAIFQNGDALFAYSLIKEAYNNFRASDVTYGFLPTPKFDEMQENYINACTDCPWAMPKTLTGEQQTIAGTIIEALSCSNYNNVLPVFYEGAIKSRIADAPDDSEMLQLIADTRIIGFAYAYDLTYKNIVADCVQGNAQVASYLKQSQKIATKTLEKLIKNFGGQ